LEFVVWVSISFFLLIRVAGSARIDECVLTPTTINLA
jgi:hypothetical protein